MRIEKAGQSITTLADWFRLAPPVKGDAHWKDGRSAKECAQAWCGGGFGPQIPEEIERLLNSHTDLRGWQLDLVTPEQRVRFDKWGEPRHSDVAAWGIDATGAICVHIEAKADESFDRRVSDVLEGAIKKISNDENTNAISRVQGLAKALLGPGKEGLPKLGNLRYQLLTAVAGLLADAQQRESAHAVFIVHEFVSNQTNSQKQQSNAKDLDDFVARLSGGQITSLANGKLEGPFMVPGTPLFTKAVPLYIGKVTWKLPQC